MPCSSEVRIVDQHQVEGNIRLDPSNDALMECATHPIQGIITRFTERYQLRQERVVVPGRIVAGVEV